MNTLQLAQFRNLCLAILRGSQLLPSEKALWDSLMGIYLVIIHDRHTDDKPFLFKDLKNALRKVQSLGYDIDSAQFGDFCLVPFPGSEDYYVSIELVQISD